MTAIQHVFKRGSVYWWRRRLPIGINAHDWVRLELSLNTKERGLARRIALEVTLASDRLLPALKAKMISTEDTRRILIQVAREHSDYLDSIARGGDAVKGRRSETASAWAIRLYTAQGESAVVGPIEERELRAAGLDDGMIHDVRRSLEFHRTSGFARPGRQKLEGILKQHGRVMMSLLSRIRIVSMADGGHRSAHAEMISASGPPNGRSVAISRERARSARSGGFRQGNGEKMLPRRKRSI